MARNAGQLISRGSRTWLVRVSLGRDPETGTSKYHNKTIRGSFRDAQTYLIGRLQEREIGRLPRAAATSLNQYLDQWLTTAAKPRLRPKSYVDYEALLRLHIRPVLETRRSAQSSSSASRASTLKCLSAGCPRERLNTRTRCYSPHSVRPSLEDAG
jgi:Phage integrase, N-terminal SAM-like domain